MNNFLANKISFLSVHDGELSTRFVRAIDEPGTILLIDFAHTFSVTCFSLGFSLRLVWCEPGVIE